MNTSLPTIIRLDAALATIAFIVLYFGRYVLSPLSGLSQEWLASLGLIPAGYALYSVCLIAFKAYRALPVGLLIGANALYSLFAAALLVAKRADLTVLGQLHLTCDFVLVGALAVVEYRILRRTLGLNKP